MVTVTGTLDGRRVKAEVHGPHDVRGDTDLVTAAAGMVRRREPVQFGQPLGGGIAGFDDDRIACVTLAEVLDPGSVSFEGLELEAPEDAIL